MCHTFISFVLLIGLSKTPVGSDCASLLWTEVVSRNPREQKIDLPHQQSKAS
jgi:hypothetical protein